MKALAILAVVGALAAPAVTFAQTTSAPLTRAQVRAELIQLEQAGYRPSAGDDANYPSDILAAEAKVAAENNAQQTNDAMGGVPLGSSSASGARMPMSTSGAKPSACVGPASFCNLYFGS